MSFRDVQQAINEHRDQKCLPLFQLGAIKDAVHQMKCHVTFVVKKAQGNYDPNSNWARARCNSTSQMLLPFGRNPDLSDFYVDGVLPDYFKKELLRAMHVHAITLLDEVHHNCFVGDLGGKVKVQYLFARSEDGNYDAKGTMYNDPAKECTFKYNSRCCFSLGVGERMVDGNLVAKRMPPYA